jgi:hypothetical protein
MTKLLEDTFRQPEELAKTPAYCLGVGRPALEAAAEILRESRHVNIAGIGSTWPVGRAVLWFFNGYTSLWAAANGSQAPSFRLFPKSASHKLQLREPFS